MSDYNNRAKIRSFHDFDFEEIKNDYDRMNSNVNDLLSHEYCTNKMMDKAAFFRNKLTLCLHKLKALDDMYSIELEAKEEREKMFPYGILDLDILELRNRRDEFDKVYSYLDNVVREYTRMISKIREIQEEK